MTATSIFFKKDGSNLIMTISILFTIIGFSYLLTLIGDDFRRNSVPTITPGLAVGERGLEFDSYENLALTTRSYILWQSLNGWLIGLRLLFYFGFSRELSMVLEIVGEALFDIVFFIFMFFIVSRKKLVLSLDFVGLCYQWIPYIWAGHTEIQESRKSYYSKSTYYHLR